jgi:tagatose-6-phosphate ketose/aldose isomerase
MTGEAVNPPSSSNPAVEKWLTALARRPGAFSALLASIFGDGRVGYAHTLREICQQPATWTESARRLVDFRPLMTQSLQSIQRIVLTGSGSSQYAGECVAPVLERRLKRSVTARAAGDLLLSRRASIGGESTLLVSLARSGDSPESVAVVHALLETEPQTRHLIITCNSAGRLAREFAANPQVSVVSLGDEVNDRSLVMTSSFTNLVLGAKFLGWLEEADVFLDSVAGLSHAGEEILKASPDGLEQAILGDIRRAVFLADDRRLGAAREGALKLLEMTAGRVATMAQTYLGLRHGPMCFIDDKTLLICFRSGDPIIRRYEEDLVMELYAKRLGARTVFCGIGDPGKGLAAERDFIVPYRICRHASEDNLAILDVMVSQILGFHRCRLEGLPPDSPSLDGIISRVVGKFQIYHPEEHQP